MEDDLPHGEHPSAEFYEIYEPRSGQPLLDSSPGLLSTGKDAPGVAQVFGSLLHSRLVV